MQHIIYITTFLALVFFTNPGPQSSDTTPFINTSDIEVIAEQGNSITATVTKKYPIRKYHEDRQSPLYNPIPRSVKVYRYHKGRYYSGTIKLEKYYRSKTDYVATYRGTIFLDHNFQRLVLRRGISND